MPLAVVEEAQADEKVAQLYGRIKELFGSDAVPTPFLALGRVPSLLQDVYMNVKKHVFGDGKLDAKTKTLVAYSVAAYSGSKPWAELLEARCRDLGWDDQAIADSVGMAAICSTYNAFFKFRDLAGKESFSGMSVGLRAHTFDQTTLDAGTGELINIAISDLNGCHACVSGHVAKASRLGVSDEAILEAVQATASIAAGIAFLRGVEA